MMKENSPSLNEISKNSAIELIEYFLKKNYNIKKIVIDTVGDPKKY